MKTTVEIKKMESMEKVLVTLIVKLSLIKGALLNEEVEIDAKQYNNKINYFGDLI